MAERGVSFTTGGPEPQHHYQPSLYRLVLVPEQNVHNLPMQKSLSGFDEQMLLVDSEMAVEVTPSLIHRNPDGNFRKITISQVAFDTMFEVI
jgi:hypothetical protein